MLFNAPLAESLHILAICLIAVGRTKESLSASREAIDLRRAITADQPVLSNGPLADYLDNLLTNLAGVGRHKEATRAEAADIRSALAVEHVAILI